MAFVENRPSVAERVGSALARGNLRQHDRSGRILQGRCDIDTIAVLGLVGINEKLADAVYRLRYANDHKSYQDALDGVYGIARSLAARYRWKANGKRLRAMSRRVLDYWINDGCTLCTGVGYEVIVNSGRLSDRVCPKCLGSRKRAMPWLKRLPRKPEGRGATRAYLQRWREVAEKVTRHMYRHRKLLVELERAELRIADRIASRLARAI